MIIKEIEYSEHLTYFIFSRNVINLFILYICVTILNYYNHEHIDV